MSIKSLISLPALAFICSLISIAQQSQLHRLHPEFTSDASIEHTGNHDIVTCNSPRPLMQAVTSLNREYGWTVNYEDPFYRDGNLVDDTDPLWRAAHGASATVRIPSGGYFRSQLPVSFSMSRKSAGEKDALTRLIADYNASGNPGQFELLRGRDDTLSVVGLLAPNPAESTTSAPALLDTRISLASISRSAAATIELILAQISARSGERIRLGVQPLNVTALNAVTVGGEEVEARDLLQYTVDQLPRKMEWQLLFDADSKLFYFNLITATRMTTDSSGKKKLEFVP